MTTQILSQGKDQLVRLPAGFEFATAEVEIRREGEAVIIEPLSPSEWPANFFADIRIDDPAFTRGGQGEMPAAPQL